MKSNPGQNCGKCGLCLSVCPVYKESAQEHTSPRARLQLIKFYKNKDIVSSAGLKQIISKCLMCGSCTSICPSGINHYSQFMAMRTQMNADHGQRPAVKSLVYLLCREYRIKFAAGFARLGQKIIPENFIKKYNLKNLAIKSFPLLNKKPFRKAVSEKITTDKHKRGTVMYFTGCATNYLFDSTGFSTLKILNSMGYDVIIPEKQTCCGIPLLFHGAGDLARKNIETNIKCLTRDDIKAIIVDCPTCGTALKNQYPDYLNIRNQDDTAARKISSKVMDIMSFVLQEKEHMNLSCEMDSLKVTYHLPCHLKNGLAAPGTTEKILNMLPQIDYRRADDADECCGGGGTFFYEYPSISKKMAERKLINARNTKADIWLTDCPVCRINLSGTLAEKDKIIVKHPAEIIQKILFNS